MSTSTLTLAIVLALFAFPALVRAAPDAAPKTSVPFAASAASPALAAAPTPPAPPVPIQARFEPAFPHLRFINPIWLGGMRDGGKTLLVAELGGQVHRFAARADVRKTTVVLDLSKRVAQRKFVEGLLGVALHPKWPVRREVYVYYAAMGESAAPAAPIPAAPAPTPGPTDNVPAAPVPAAPAMSPAPLPPAEAVLSRFLWPVGKPAIDPNSERVLLRIENPNSQHHGGSVEFGPDGMLYLSVGDMGPQHDTGNFAQNLGSLRGKILRLDVDTSTEAEPFRIPADNPFRQRPGAKPEIWAYGLRNPYRMSFDFSTGGLWVGDVGYLTEEEVDLVTRGGNYGWNVREGNAEHRKLDAQKYPATDAPPPRFVPPVLAYGRKVGLSVTGGYVYRGKAIPALVGAYVYGDWASSAAFYLRYDGERVTEAGTIGKVVNPNSFGRDDQGELLALALDGRVFRLAAGVPIPAPPFVEKPPTNDEPAVSEDALRALARNATTVAAGARLFQRGCQACHGMLAEGGVGPNLTDDAWLHGSNLVEIHRSISRGNASAGMPPWAEIYGSAELQALTVFVASLSLGDPVPGKPAQGKPAPITYQVAEPPRSLRLKVPAVAQQIASKRNLRPGAAPKR